ncbi:hypothetical protein [Kordia sp.]|uniref:hypothetical protein n=1 Tax=Kordia sp. TaxID=1965332 RepID=UPI003B5BC367
MKKSYKSIEETIAEVRKKDKRYNYIILIVILIMIAVIASIIIYTQNKKNKANMELIAKYEMQFIENERLKQKDSLQTDSITRLVETLRKELARIEKDLNDEDKPREARDVVLQNVNLAQDKLNRITNNVSDNTIVRYYKRKADSPKIKLLIQSMKDPSFTLNLKNVTNDDGRTKVNTIYYSKNVDKDELSDLVEGLLSIGVDIKNIKPFTATNGYEWKNSVIEIGYEATTSVTKSITKSDLSKYKATNDHKKYNIRFYCYKPNVKNKKQLTQYIKSLSYNLKVYPDWKKKPSFFANTPTIFYYSDKSKKEAYELKNQLNKKIRGLKFELQRGNGYGISKKELDNTFIVHYLE